MKLITYTNELDWQRGITLQIIDELKREAEVLEFQTLVVPGGTTPGPIFEKLSTGCLDWSKVIVIPSDERCVPLNTARSNYNLIKQTLLKNNASSAEIISLYKENWKASHFHQLEQKLASVLPVSVCILGMGEDLHTASLFPNSPDLDTALSAHSSHAVRVSVPNQPEERITLSFNVLVQAQHIHVIFKGKTKKQNLMQSFRSENPRNAPILYFAKKATFHCLD